MGDIAPADRPSSPLAHQIEAQTRDLDWTLAHFAFVANVTTLAAECDIAHSPAMSVASCHGMEQPALAFIGDSPELLADYAAFLADPGSEVYLLVNEEQRAVVQEAFHVLDVQPQWQMVFEGAPESLVASHITRLTAEDLPAMQALARGEKLPFQTLARNPFDQGPAYGVWDKKRLVAMGTTNVRLPGAAQIGNLVTRKDCRNRGYGTEVVSALVRDLTAEGLSAFLIVTQSDIDVIRLFEQLGFARTRPMYLMHCVLRENETGAAEKEKG